MIFKTHRIAGLVLLMLLSGCSWLDDPGPGGTKARSSLSPSRDALSIPSIGDRTGVPSQSERISQIRERAKQRQEDVNYSDVIDPSRNASAQITPNSAQQINDLFLSGKLSNVANEISRCSKNKSSTSSSSGCSTSSIKKSIDDLSQRTSRSASRFSDPRVKKSFRTVCSRCQYQSKSKRICVNSKTQTRQCPTCGQIMKEMKSYNEIAKYMRQTNMTSSDNTVSCNVNQLRHGHGQMRNNNQTNSKMSTKH